MSGNGNGNALGKRLPEIERQAGVSSAPPEPKASVRQHQGEGSEVVKTAEAAGKISRIFDDLPFRQMDNVFDFLKAVHRTASGEAENQVYADACKRLPDMPPSEEMQFLFQDKPDPTIRKRHWYFLWLR